MLLEESHTIHLSIVYGCFHPAMAELSAGKRDYTAHQMQHICYLAQYRKSLPISDLKHCSLKGKSLFSYTDAHGLKGIRYLQRSAWLSQCLLLDLLNLFYAVSEKEFMGVLGCLFTSSRLCFV